MKGTLATMAVEMRPDEKAVLQVGLVPVRHMAAIRQMTELTTGQTRAALATRIAQLETALTTAGGSVPTATGKTRRDMVDRISRLEKELTKQGASIPAAAVVKPRTAKTTTTAATTQTTTTTTAKVPTLTHAAAVRQAGVESIRQAREAQAQAKRDKELEDARNLGAKVIEDEKRKAAFAPVAAAMDAAAVKPSTVAKAKATAKTDKAEAMPHYAEYTRLKAIHPQKARTYWRENEAAIKTEQRNTNA